MLTATLSQSRLPAELVQDITVGNVLSAGGGATEFRAAALAAGFPPSTAVRSTNRQCASGLQAVVDVAHAIRAGMIDIGIGAGVESMSLGYGPSAVSEFSELLEEHEAAAECKVPMGVLSEDATRARGISREKQDAFAAESHAKALRAWREGRFEGQVVPVRARVLDPKTGEEREVLVSRDDGVREGVTMESLGKLKPAFSDEDGASITAGTASQTTDGAAAVLLMRRSTAEKLGQRILGKFVCASVVGVPPLLMGDGPAYAIPAVLEKAGLKVEEVDVFEINEAFASQCVWCVEKLGISMEKVNPCGGAIALGHPLGCTGARQVGTLLGELRRRGERIGVSSMCVGTVSMSCSCEW